jgi:hypothetical protein
MTAFRPIAISVATMRMIAVRALDADATGVRVCVVMSTSVVMELRFRMVP